MALVNSVVLAERLLGDVPPDAARTFTAEQISAIDAALRKQYGPKKHPVDMRMRFGLGAKRLYAVFLVGSENRPERRPYEMSSLGNAMTMSMLGAIVALQFVFLSAIF
ncbi:MAG: hypothetical protein K9J76_02345 [Polaromonas sp.]|nr:hypothetical protein [Polaromonas sp.]